MANRKFLWGMLSAMLVFGLTLGGCDDSTETPPPNTDPKTITITGIPSDIRGSIITISIVANGEDDDVARGTATIPNSGSVTVSLKNQDAENSNWTGTGSYFMMLGIGSAMYLYTEGKTFVELGIHSQEDFATKLLKYNIKDATSTIPFDMFKPANGG